MNCEDFKKHIVDLCDKRTDATTTTECMRHIEECASCRAYYEEFMQTVSLLTPKHMPFTGTRRQHTAVPSTSPVKEKKIRPASRWRQAAAAFVIFTAGVATGLSNFFSTRAEAGTTIPLIFEQSVRSTRCTNSFSISAYIRTSPDENFAYISPDCDFIKVDLKVLRQHKANIWRLEKKGGRTIVSDGKRQYMWTTDGTGVIGGTDANFAEGFASLLHPETLLEQQMAALSDEKRDRTGITETDSTITVTTHTEVYGLDLLPQSGAGTRTYRCITENVFSKHDGLLQQIQMWWECDGRKTLVMKSERIAYNVPLTTGQLIKCPDTEHIVWRNAEGPGHVSKKTLKRLKEETAPQAAQRILHALINDMPGTAGEALYQYAAQLPALIREMKDCKVSDLEERKDKGGYAGSVVTYKITLPDGNTELRQMFLRRDNPQKIWVVDGGL